MLGLRVQGLGRTFRSNTGALIIRIGSWSPLYYNHHKEAPKIVFLIMKAPIVRDLQTSSAPESSSKVPSL